MHALSLALARRPEVAEFARALTESAPSRSRLARITALFTFVSHLVDVPAEPYEGPGDGVDVLMALAGRRQGPAVVLAALLRAAGERVRLEAAGGIVFVCVELEEEDWAHLPPHAVPLRRGSRRFLPLDPRDARRPFGFLPQPLRARSLPRPS